MKKKPYALGERWLAVPTIEATAWIQKRYMPHRVVPVIGMGELRADRKLAREEETGEYTSVKWV